MPADAAGPIRLLLVEDDLPLAELLADYLRTGGFAVEIESHGERAVQLVTAHGELLRMVSHELRTPIQRLHVALEMAAGAPDDAAREHRLARMVIDHRVVRHAPHGRRSVRQAAVLVKNVLTGHWACDSIGGSAGLNGNGNLRVCANIPGFGQACDTLD